MTPEEPVGVGTVVTGGANGDDKRCRTTDWSKAGERPLGGVVIHLESVRREYCLHYNEELRVGAAT